MHRFSGHSSYDLAEKFNNIKQGNMSVPEYTDSFEELMENVQEENQNYLRAGSLNAM